MGISIREKGKESFAAFRAGNRAPTGVGSGWVNNSYHGGRKPKSLPSVILKNRPDL